MLTKSTFFAVLFFSCQLSLAQQKCEGIVWNANDNLPIEFVSVYNFKQNTTTNGQGRFMLFPKSDSIYFYRPGYNKLATTFNQINDTIYLEKSRISLNEVVVTDAKTIYQRIKDSIQQNYLLKPHTETFFLRTTLRKNKDLVRFQDFYGRVKRKTSIYTGKLELEKDDFQIQLQQMRKVGVGKEADDIYFAFPSFHQIYTETVRINAMGPNFEITEKPYADNDLIKVEFKLEPNGNRNKSHGHYIINGADNAIISFNAIVIPHYKTAPKENEHFSRLISRVDKINFSKDPKSGFYFIKIAKRKMVFEIRSEKQSKINTYELEITLNTINSFETKKFKSNINEEKDIFKIRYKYDKVFWNRQNHLLLTGEMFELIENARK